MNVTLPRRAVFLDRDGTLNKDVHYLSRAGDFEWIPGTIDGLKALKDAGWALVVITNQSGIAQGKLTHKDLEAIHGRMLCDLKKQGVELDGVYYCPHHPKLGAKPGPCNCRKPEPGLIQQAASDLNLDLANSWMVGDSVRDLLAGHQMGMASILVRTGKGSAQEAELEAHPSINTLVAEDMAQAATWILARQEN
ncbi:MAG: D-glycero-beta-D-manno-heptose 1,7-bisphosphate 7-phosphatase [bacterium]|nr:D-glycero-beta-D-manno-heptose 1,7-bisphosphate 7-phosphatase [bacterium]